MAGEIRARGSVQDGVADVRALINHPMEVPEPENGKAGHFIQEVFAEVNGEQILHAHWGPGISANPLIEIRCRAQPGDVVRLSFSDNQGQSGSHELKLS